MPLTLEQYLEHLDSRSELPWPSAPDVDKPKARPHLTRLPEVRAVTWNVYGTLLAMSGGELWFEHPNDFIMETALEKTIQEFKMWQSMTRKPGKPSVYMKQLYGNALTEQRMTSGGDRNPEVLSEKVWQGIIKKLMTNEYNFNASFYGSIEDYCRKIAYFFHASLQGVACYPGALSALTHVQQTIGHQGILADGQCFTPAQLQRALRQEGYPGNLHDLIPETQQVWSFILKAKKPSERPFKEMLGRLRGKGIEAKEILHVGNSIDKDVAPAKKLGMRTALFAGDKASLFATPEQLKQPNTRPDVLLTDLSQISEVVG